MVEMTYELLRKVQADERQGSALSRLPDEFYESVRSMIAQRRDDLNKSFSLADAKEFENVLKVLRDIIALREQKMVLRALAAAGGARDGSALSPEEREAFDKIVAILEERKRWAEELFEGRKGKEKKDEANARIRLLVPMPEYVGADGKTYGPFESGDEVLVPAKEARLLVKRKAAEALG